MSGPTNPTSKGRIWATATVRVFSDCLSRSEIADHLGIESEPAKELAGHPALWLMTSRLDRWTHPLDDHIVDVLDQIDGRQAQFLAIWEFGRSEVFVGTNGAVGQTGMWLSIPAALIHRMADFGLAFTADLYA
jgi:hypothetical protein